jgi:TetR/AcrR family transcriptional regulator, cholesterol catabolism regulator
VLVGRGADFIPVMLYEWRSLNPRQRKQMTLIKDDYEAVWTPVLQALHDAGQLGCDVKLARLMIFGALNWSAQWFDARQARHGGATLDQLAAAAMALFLNKEAS